MSTETKTERVLRDVLNSDNLRDLLGEDAVNNAMKWRFLQGALVVLDGHGLLGDPADAVKEATPVPLDPSKVRAGDTVALLVDPPDTHPAFTVAGETHSLGGPTVYLGGWRVDDLPDYVTLTAHQPAPEPEPEWKPGTVAVVVQGGDPGAGVDDHEFRAALQTDGMWVGLAGEAATSAPVSVRPLVVIDPAAVDVEALAEALRREWSGKDFGVTFSWDAIARTLLAALGIEATS